MLIRTSKVSWVDRRNNLSIIGDPEHGFCVLKYRYLPIYAGSWDDCAYIAQCVSVSLNNRNVPVYLDKHYLPCSESEAVYAIEYRDHTGKYQATYNGAEDKDLHGYLHTVLYGVFLSDSPFTVIDDGEKYTLCVLAEHLGQAIHIRNSHGLHVQYLSIGKVS